MKTLNSDAIFVFPPAEARAGSFKGHLGVAYLRAALARAGLKSIQYLRDDPGTIDSVAAEILRCKAPVIGFTVYDGNAALCIAIARSLKGQRPDVRIVFGGPTVTFHAKALMERHDFIDVSVLGEGEETGPEIFGALLDGRALDPSRPGVAFRSGDEVICTALPPLVGGDALGINAALDCVPSPYLSGLLTDGRAGVLTGRGCTHHCQYCCFAALGRKRLRLHSIERVIAELETIAELQKRGGERYPIAIHDDAFTLLPPRAKALCRAIADRKLGLLLSCITRADTVDDELLQLMREAGFISLAFGLESAVPSVLRATGKVRPPDWPVQDLEPERRFLERFRASVLTAKKQRFRVGVSIILGLPTETAADGTETLRFLRELPIDYYMHNLLWVFPGTPLWETRQRYGIECTTDEIGLPATSDYAYDVRALKPGPKSALEQDAHLVRLLAIDALWSCDASLTGERGTRTAVIERDRLWPQTAAWLRDVLSIGGTVLQIYPAANARKTEQTLSQDRFLLADRMIPARFHIQLESPKLRGQNERWRLACSSVELYERHKPALLTIRASKDAAPLAAWANGEGTGAALCDVSTELQRPSRLVSAMEKIVARGASSLPSMPIPPRTKYPGRWLTQRAPCMSLQRIEIDNRGKVRCCRQGEPIGAVGDSREALRRSLATLARKAAKRRGCAKCPLTHCPRCPFPGVDDLTYCQIMRSRKRVRRALEWTELYARLPFLVAVEWDRMAAE